MCVDTHGPPLRKHGATEGLSLVDQGAAGEAKEHIFKRGPSRKDHVRLKVVIRKVSNGLLGIICVDEGAIGEDLGAISEFFDARDVLLELAGGKPQFDNLAWRIPLDQSNR